jgi:uncharacterized protein DUF6282
MWNQVEDLMVGACDLHIHAGPDITPRQQDIIEVCTDAQNAGMKALAFKDHNTSTSDRVKIAKQLFPGALNLFGGIVLNHAVGGFNPEAVEKALFAGAKIVWMPSADASLTIEKVHVTKETPWFSSAVKLTDPKKGLHVLNTGDVKEGIRSDVKQILQLIAENDAVLDTCHLSARECAVLIDTAKDIGVNKIIVTHPNCSINYMTIREQKMLAQKDVFLNYAFLPCMPLFDRQHPKDILEMMVAVGIDHCLMFSDFGQIVNPSPVDGYKMFIASLLALGMEKADIKKVAALNPARLMDLE